MISFDFQSNCTGCKACSDVCPTKAIDFYIGEDSFWYPHVNEELCVGCDKCSKVCPVERANSKGAQEKSVKTWLYSSENEEAKLYSSSGAAFYDLADYMLKTGGIVFGCKWDDKLEAVHGSANSLAELRKLQGSKYVQSNTGHVYEEVVLRLKEGKQVLFSGLPCQCLALRNFVELESKENKNNNEIKPTK